MGLMKTVLLILLAVVLVLGGVSVGLGLMKTVLFILLAVVFVVHIWEEYI